MTDREARSAAQDRCRWPWSHVWKPYKATIGVQQGMAGTRWTATQVRERCEKCGDRRARVVDGEWSVKDGELV